MGFAPFTFVKLYICQKTPPVPALNGPKRRCFSLFFLFYIAKKAWLTTTIPEVILGKQKSTRKIHLSYISRTFHLSRRRCLKDLVFLLFKSLLKLSVFEKDVLSVASTRSLWAYWTPKVISFFGRHLQRELCGVTGTTLCNPQSVWHPSENERIRPTKKDHFIWKWIIFQPLNIRKSILLVLGGVYLKIWSQ